MNKRAFTLAEVLLVLVMISGLMFLIIPNVNNTKSNIDDKTCKAYIELVNSQIQNYYLENGHYPENLGELVDNNYLRSTTCPNGSEIDYQDNVASINEP